LFNVSEVINISANVSDNYLLDTVIANISWQQGYQELELFHDGNNIYNASFIPTIAGKHTASCNIASVCLMNFTKEVENREYFDYDLFSEVVQHMTLLLNDIMDSADNVSDKVKTSNEAIRPVNSGLVKEPNEDNFNFWLTLQDMSLAVPKGVVNAVEEQGDGWDYVYVDNINDARDVLKDNYGDQTGFIKNLYIRSHGYTSLCQTQSDCRRKYARSCLSVGSLVSKTRDSQTHGQGTTQSTHHVAKWWH